MSDDLPGFNAPRRKARFRSRYDDDVYRRAPSSKPAEAQDPAGEENGQEAPPASEHDPEPLPTAGTAEPTVAPAAPEADGAVPAGNRPVEGQDDLLPNFRLNKVYEARPERANPFTDWRWLLLTLGLVAAGVGGGYTLGLANAPAAKPVGQAADRQPAKLIINALSEKVQDQVDAAFDATKQSHYKEAHDLFVALHDQHPEWWSMTIEAARASLYLHDTLEAQRTLHTVSAEQGLPDVDFILGLLHLTNQEMPLAEASFSAAVARDPARPDFYFFWGECLRREGKPLEAVKKFQAALVRNQYEYAEGLYQLKFWLSQIQADQEEPSGSNKAIDTALAGAHPSYEALFAAAARELKGKRYKEAASDIARAQNVTEPAVFRVIMQDPTFTEQSVHPEIQAFYK